MQRYSLNILKKSLGRLPQYKIPRQLQTPSINYSKLPSSFYIVKRGFCTQNDNNEKVNSKMEVEQQLIGDKELEQILKKLRQKEETPKEQKLYTTPSLTVYENTFDFSQVKYRIRRLYFGMSIWLGLGYVVYVYIHPLAAIVPAWLFSGAIMNVLVIRQYFKKLITKIELTKDQKHVRFISPYNPKQKEILCEFDNVELFDIKEVNEKFNASNTNNNNTSNNSDSENTFKTILCTLNLLDVNEKLHKDHKIVLEQYNSIVPNHDFLADVLNGQQNLVKLYSLVTPEQYSQQLEQLNIDHPNTTPNNTNTEEKDK